MKRKKLLLIIAAIIILGSAAFAFLYFETDKSIWHFGGQPQADFTKPPKFLFAISNEPSHPLQRPMAVLVVNADIYVADSGRVLVFDYNGKFIKYLTPGPNKFESPYGLAFDGNTIYVADTKSARIFCFDADGGYKGVLTVKGATLSAPAWLYYGNSYLFVSDLHQHKVYALDYLGNVVQSFGSEGHGPGQLYFPHGVAVDEKGTVYIADSGNNRIAVFDPQGKPEPPIGGETGITVPRGLVLDRTGSIWVVAGLAYGNQIRSYTFNGDEIFEFGRAGEDYGKLSLPNGIYIDTNDRIYITEVGNSRVSVYGY